MKRGIIALTAVLLIAFANTASADIKVEDLAGKSCTGTTEVAQGRDAGKKEPIVYVFAKQGETLKVEVKTSETRTANVMVGKNVTFRTDSGFSHAYQYANGKLVGDMRAQVQVKGRVVDVVIKAEATCS